MIRTLAPPVGHPAEAAPRRNRARGGRFVAVHSRAGRGLEGGPDKPSVGGLVFETKRTAGADPLVAG
ncbi:MAG: hypothetical protein AB8B36_10685 [Prochlorococcus sp.]